MSRSPRPRGGPRASAWRVALAGAHHRAARVRRPCDDRTVRRAHLERGRRLAGALSGCGLRGLAGRDGALTAGSPETIGGCPRA